MLIALPGLAEFTSPWRSSSYAPGHPDVTIERRFPPHLTLLTPFADPEDGAAVERLRRVAAAQPPLDLVFQHAQRFVAGPAVWLRPEPDAQVRELQDAVLREFPDLPPYGGRHADPTPHVTVTVTGDEEVLRDVRRALAETGPLTARVERLGVWVRGDDDVWVEQCSVPLGGGPAADGTGPATRPSGAPR